MTRFGLAAALAVALATPGAAHPPYDSLPLAPPGVLPGRILYQTSDRCEFRSYDLRTGTDSLVGHANCGSSVLLSNDGRLAAERAERERVRVLDVATGKVLWLGPVVPQRHAPAFSFPLFFSPDSSRLAYCTIGRASVSTVVADARTGAVRSRIRGSCDVAATRRGVAFVRRGRVLLGRHVLFTPRGARIAPALGSARSRRTRRARSSPSRSGGAGRRSNSSSSTSPDESVAATAAPSASRSRRSGSRLTGARRSSGGGASFSSRRSTGRTAGSGSSTAPTASRSRTRRTRRTGATRRWRGRRS